MQEIIKKNAIELNKAFTSGELSSEEITSAFLKQIEKENPAVNAFVRVNDKALAAAKDQDAKKQKGEKLGPLAGVPVGVKEMFCTEGLETTACSKILKGFIPPYSATVVKKLEAAGAIPIGKCNQDEFAMGSSNENSIYGAVKNPWDHERVPGGSSGGSAAAVSGAMSPISLGTDTGGSIRQPAHFCGVVGVKPTYGRVSRYGIIAFASSLDQAGPFSKTVKEAALVSEIISGQDPMDGTTSSKPVPAWSKEITPDLKGLTIGLPKEYFAEGLEDEVKEAVEKTIEWVKAAGATTVEVSLPNTELSVPVYYLVATSEASSNLSRYDGVRFGSRADFEAKPPADLADFYSRNRGEGFSAEVKRRIMLGTYALSSGYYDAYYKKACQVRRLLRDDFLKAFSSCDVLLSPVTTTPAFKLKEKVSNPLAMYLNDIYTTSTNLAGLPGMSVPCGFTKSGLPIGLQLTAKHFEEQKMFNVAQAVEDAANIKTRWPNGI